MLRGERIKFGLAMCRKVMLKRRGASERACQNEVSQLGLYWGPS